MRRIEKTITPPPEKKRRVTSKIGQMSIQINPTRIFIFQPSQIPLSISQSGFKDSHLLSYLTVNLHGPISLICRSITSPTYQEDSPRQSAKKRSFLALATTFYGLGHMRESLMLDGRQMYLDALNMVHRSVRESSGSGVTEIISSILALCLHEVNIPKLTFPCTIANRTGNRTDADDRTWLVTTHRRTRATPCNAEPFDD
jgi:hypothetical protein